MRTHKKGKCGLVHLREGGGGSVSGGGGLLGEDHHWLPH